MVNPPDFRNRPKWQQALINLKWKIIKNTHGIKALYLLIVIMMVFMMIFQLAIEPMINPRPEILKPACESVCDIPL